MKGWYLGGMTLSAKKRTIAGGTIAGTLSTAKSCRRWFDWTVKSIWWGSALLLCMAAGAQDAGSGKPYDGEWKAHKYKDPMTDEVTDFFDMRGEYTDRAQPKPLLMVACAKGQLKGATLMVDKILDDAPALVRVDEGKAASANLHRMSDMKGVVLLPDVLRVVMAGQKILIRLSAYQAGYLTMEFHPFAADRSGMSRACGVEPSK